MSMSPENKTIVVLGCFEDPIDIRSNKLSTTELEEIHGETIWIK